MQGDPIKPTSKAPGTKRSNLKYDELPSNFAFNLILRRYMKEGFRSLIRKCLVEHSSISFHSEFSDLRDWIRGRDLHSSTSQLNLSRF